VSPLFGKARGPGRSRWLVRGLLIVAAGVGLLAWALVPPKLVIENRSGQTIPFLQLTVAGEKASFKDVKSGASVTVPMKVNESDPFTVEGRLVDDTRIRGAGVLGENGLILVLPGGQLELKRRDSNPFGSERAP
jgi:hypothetical protein